jgi:hypothetical protein
MKLGAAGKPQGRSLPRLLVSCWASSGPSESEQRRPPASKPQHDKIYRKTKTFLISKKQRQFIMNRATQLEHRASSRLGKHEGEPSLGLCDRPDWTRDNSQRQLPTDHNYAVPTREYQTDQSSLKPPRLLLALCSGKSKNNNKNNPIDSAGLTPSLHIRPMHSLSYSSQSVFSATCQGYPGCELGEPSPPEDSGFRVFSDPVYRASSWVGSSCPSPHWLTFSHDCRPPLRRIVGLMGQ